MTIPRPLDLYRLPWNLNDNVLSWLEPTKACNLYCEGCYSRNDPSSHKSMDEVRADLRVFAQNRTMDSVSIAGGDPLVHPEIVEIVRIVREEFGLKPVLNTNALALTPELIRSLKDAGLYGFTFHIDSSQNRPKWKKAGELDLADLRLHYARMVADVGGLSVAFNCTIFPHNLQDIPPMLDWAAEHIDVVHSMVFILFRTSRAEVFDYYANGTDTNAEDLTYYGQEKNPEPLTAQDVLGLLEKTHPDFQPCAYLGGTKDPMAFKWLLSGRIGSRESISGYVGPKYMEFIQSAHHLFAGRYLGYVEPELLSHGRAMMGAFSAIDKGARAAARKWLGRSLRRPWTALHKQHFQSVLIIQPIDMMADGEMSMCDGCPDMTVHDGQLVWSCRLDELKEHGCFLTAAPKALPPEAISAK
jgi:pyruvate-formate lyase-activating enzyme